MSDYIVLAVLLNMFALNISKDIKHFDEEDNT